MLQKNEKNKEKDLIKGENHNLKYILNEALHKGIGTEHRNQMGL